jgi:3-hydroxyisobutyrate dehydrogenase-like beta-hydroxyacid dehydrogenase
MSEGQIGFIGVGRMGGAIAQRLLGMGAELIVYDTNAENMQPFLERGVATATSPRDVADQAAIVLACLPSPAASVEVAFGQNGVAHGRAVKLYVETSTLGRKTAEYLAASLPASIGFVDSPVSGGPPGAQAGTLTTMASGPRPYYERALPVLSLMAQHVFYVGSECGMAQIAKLINNHLSTAGRLAAFEGLVMALKAGLDVRSLIDLINVSSGRNSTTLEKIPLALFSGGSKSNSQMTLSLKDEALLIEEAEKLGAGLWVAPRLLETLQEAAAAGYRDKDSMMLVQYLGEQSGIDVTALIEQQRKEIGGD